MCAALCVACVCAACVDDDAPQDGEYHQEIVAFETLRLDAGVAGSAAYTDAADVAHYLEQIYPEVTADLEDGTTALVTVVAWNDTEGYDADKAGAYTFEAGLGALPAACRNTGGHTPKVIVSLGSPEESSAVQLEDGVIIPVVFNEAEQEVTLSAAQAGKSVFLVKVNTGASLVKAADSGGVANAAAQSRQAYSAQSALEAPTPPDGPVDYARARDWIAPAALAPAKAQASTLPENSRAASVGSAKSFWVQNAAGAWITVTATLRSQGTHCNIWVNTANYSAGSTQNNDNKITRQQASELATAFDTIYALETNLIGYEYGGDPADNHDGIDGDPRIQILVYDIGFDYSAAQNGGVYGYYWAKDSYSDDETQKYNMRSNECEMFYVDAHFVDCDKDRILSTLTHEFQHMINFNQKTVSHSINISTWYNEMLSMLVEDTLDSFINIPVTNQAHPSLSRAAYFMNFYDKEPINTWKESETDLAEALISYARSYFFGAYLVRNYGGPALLREMVRNAYADEASITHALQTVTGDAALTVWKALESYGQALVFSRSVCEDGLPADVHTFDKTVSGTIGGQEYSFPAFDIWERSAGETAFTDSAGIRHTQNADGKGPHLHSLSAQLPLPAYSLQVFTTAAKLTDNYVLTLQKPAGANVKLFIMVR